MEADRTPSENLLPVRPLSVTGAQNYIFNKYAKFYKDWLKISCFDGK